MPQLILDSAAVSPAPSTPSQSTGSKHRLSGQWRGGNGNLPLLLFFFFFSPQDSFKLQYLNYLPMPGQMNSPRNESLLKKEALRLVSGTKLACGRSQTGSAQRGRLLKCCYIRRRLLSFMND